MGDQGKMKRNSRFVRKFKTMKSIHDVQFWVFHFLKQEICAQGCGRINLERMAIVEIMYTYIIIGNVHNLTDVPLLDFGKQWQLDFGVCVLSSW